MSVSENIPEQRLSASDSVEAIDGIFAVAKDQTLVWNNDAFENGTARFGTDYFGVYAVFQGTISARLTEVSLKVTDRRFHNPTASFDFVGYRRILIISSLAISFQLP